MKTLFEEERGKPDFYIASSEGYDMQEPREAWFIERVKTQYHDDWMWVAINPPIIGQKYGLGGKDIDTVMILPRHKGMSLFPPNEWPLCVYVVRLLVSPWALDDMVPEGSYECIAWAELYKTRDDAIEAMKFWDNTPNVSL